MNTVDRNNIECIAHLKWEKNGKPEGRSEEFWLEAEKEWQDYPKETLKLPICPVCKNTSFVEDNCYAIVDPGYHCSDCGIEWNSRLLHIAKWWLKSERRKSCY